MTKHWINTNQGSINAAFSSYTKNNFRQVNGRCDDDSYVDLNSEGRLAYVYMVSDHYQSSYTNQESDTYESHYNYDHHNRMVRFYVGLVVPKLKKDHVCAIALLVQAEMKTEFYRYDASDWYHTYGFECKAINVTRVTEIVKYYLEEKGMYRDKDVFIKN